MDAKCAAKSGLFSLFGCGELGEYVCTVCIRHVCQTHATPKTIFQDGDPKPVMVHQCPACYAEEHENDKDESDSSSASTGTTPFNSNDRDSVSTRTSQTDRSGSGSSFRDS